MMKKMYVGIFFISLLLVLGACSDKDKQVSKDTNKDNTEEKSKEAVSPVNQVNSIILGDSRKKLKAQQGGKLMKDMTLKAELEQADNAELSNKTVRELKSSLEKLTDETQNPVKLQKGLVYLLGSHYYPEVIEQAEDFEPEFEEPFLPNPGKSAEEVKNEPRSGKAIILLDASSSMLLRVDDEVKMDIAKDAVKRFAETIGQENEVSLVVYGHKGSESDADKQLSCTGIEEIYPMNSYDQEVFEESLATFKSKGWTPLAGAIKKATEMSKDMDGTITVYIVSDGVETCDGDPVKEAKAFIKNNEKRTVNIIGFHVDKDAESQLKAVSTAGKGEYYGADDADDLQTTIEKEWLPSNIDLAWAFTKAPGPWEKLDEYERFDKELEIIRTIIKNEKARYDEALAILREEEMLDSDVRDKLKTLISDRYRNMMDQMQDFRSEKIAEIDERSDDIHEQVEAWTEEMRKRKKERGDLW
ncbi:vWA domain-containing protein [Virgibacillus sp. FSP13]